MGNSITGITGTILQHMNHTEDLILQGEKACEYVLRTLGEVSRILRKEKSDSRITVKLDGAPNIVAASDYQGKCFVGTKYSFKSNTSELRPEKLAFNDDQLSNISENEVVQKKLRMLLKVLPFIDIPKDEIWSGDYLFSNEDLKLRNIEGEECICFHPNTIIYAVPTSDPLSKELERSNFGVAWHTKYKGPDLSHLRVNFDVDISQIQKVPNVFQMDANLSLDRSNLSEEEIKYASSALLNIEGNLQKLISSDFYSRLLENPQYIQYLNTYRNALIRTNNQEPDAEGFFDWMGAKYDKLIDSKKTPKAKEIWGAKKEIALSLYKEEDINMLYDIQNSIRSLKEFFIQKLDQSASLKTYLKYRDGRYEKANAEGYAVSDLEGNIQKLVSRLDFSRANFSADVVKGWTSEKREAKMNIKESSIKKFKEEENLERVKPFLEEEEFEDPIEKLKSELNISNKKEPQTFERGRRIKYVLQPEDGDSREIKAERVHNILKGSSLYYKGRTPIVEYSYQGVLYQLIFKPRLGGAISTKGDEIYWAYCMALVANGKGGLLPLDEEDIENFDMSIIGEDPSLKGKTSNLIGYTEGSALFCKEYLLPNSSYLFFREDTCINLINNTHYESLHSLINKALEYIPDLGFKKKDIWNPSDIVACEINAYYPFKNEWEKALKDNPSLENLNSLLLKYLKEKRVVGISLKDTTNPHLEEVGMSPTRDLGERNLTVKEIWYPPLLPFEDAVLKFPRAVKRGLYILYTKGEESVKTQYRLTSLTEMQIESYVESSKARLGKTGKHILKRLYAKYGVGDLLTFKQSEDLMKNNPSSLFGKIEVIENSSLPLNNLGPSLNVDNFKSLVGNDEEKNSTLSIWPRLINFLYMLAKANNLGELESVINDIYLGAKKEEKFCAPYIKLY